MTTTTTTLIKSAWADIWVSKYIKVKVQVCLLSRRLPILCKAELRNSRGYEDEFISSFDWWLGT